MQDVKKNIPFLGIVRKIAAVIAVAVVLVSPLCAQNVLGIKECESIYDAAIQAEQRKDLVEAELRYEECREAAKQFRLPKMEAATLHRLAVIKARDRKFTESLRLFERAIALDPKNASILCDFAQLYADRKDFRQAETILHKANGLAPNNPKVLFKLGEVIALQQSKTRKIEGFRYLKLAVGEAQAYREIARIYRSEGDIGQAEWAEENAKKAEGGQISALDTETTTILLPQRIPTLPESVNRAGEESGAVKNSGNVSIRQQAAWQPNIFVSAAQPSSVQPVDPFASDVSLQELVTTDHFSTPVVRGLPDHSESPQDIQPQSLYSPVLPNVFEPFGYIDKYLIDDFSVPSVLWGIDGDWMVNYMPSNKPFYPTDHCGVLRVKTNDVLPKYLAWILEKEGVEQRFSRTLRASIDRIKGLSIKTPPLPEQQKTVLEIEKIEAQIQETQKELEQLSDQKRSVIKNYL